MSRATLFVLFAAPAALLIACGGDTTTGTTSTGAGGSSTTTSAAGTGGTTAVTTGAGGSATTTTTGTSTSAGTTGSTSATGSTGSSMAMGACTNAADQAIVTTKDVAKITGDCAQASLGAEPATKNCIKMGTGLSDPCVTCFDATVACVVANCFFQCSTDSASQACTDCRAAKCDPAFVMCSGLPSN